MTVATKFFNWPRSGIDNERPPYEACSPNLVTLRSYLQGRWGGEYLGCHGDRDNRDGTSLSTHAYGAALDWRYPTRQLAVAEILPFLIDNSAELGIMSIHDYVADRIWHAGRTSSTNPADWWKIQNGAGAGMGEAWATYLHIETHPDAFALSTPIADRLTTQPPNPDPQEDDMTPEQSRKLDAIHDALLVKSYADGSSLSVVHAVHQIHVIMRTFWDGYPGNIQDGPGVFARTIKRIAGHLGVDTK